jgi:hypothetical protein
VNDDKSVLKNLRLPLIAAGLLAASYLPQLGARVVPEDDACINQWLDCNSECRAECGNDPQCVIDNCYPYCNALLCICETMQGNPNYCC